MKTPNTFVIYFHLLFSKVLFCTNRIYNRCILTANPWCESPIPPHPKGALLDWDLVTVEAIWVKWSHCHVQETSLRWFELYDMVTGAAPGVVFCLLLPFYHLSPVCPFSSDLWHQQGIFIHTTAAHLIFSLFRSVRWLCVKIPVDQQFLKYSDQPVWHQQPFHVQSHLNTLSSPFWCSVWTSASRLHHI